MLALNATPTPQIPLPDSAATSPAHFVPWLKFSQRINSKIQLASYPEVLFQSLVNKIARYLSGQELP